MDISVKDHATEVGLAYLAEEKRKEDAVANLRKSIATSTLRRAGFDETICPVLIFDRHYHGIVQMNYRPVDRYSGLSNEIYSATITERDDMRIEILLGLSHYSSREVLTVLYLRRETLFSKMFGSFFDSKIRIAHVGEILKYL